MRLMGLSPILKRIADKLFYKGAKCRNLCDREMKFRRKKNVERGGFIERRANRKKVYKLPAEERKWKPRNAIVIEGGNMLEEW